MPRRPENPGTCACCGEVITKRSVRRHLEKCPKWQGILAAADASSRLVSILWHLRVQDADIKDYWLDLEMTGTASLNTLDNYLRAIWLECCGHLSQFTIGGWGGMVVGKARKGDTVFEPGLVLRHLYDYGDTSETNIRVVGYRQGKATSRHPIVLLARNRLPQIFCKECDRSAQWLCIHCLFEQEEPGDQFFCDAHIKDHPHTDYGEPLTLVNSPRFGRCGYDGPAEPPY